MVPSKHGTVQSSGLQLEPGNGDAGPSKEVPTHLKYHHASHKFDMVAQGSKTIQELMNDLMNYTT